MKSDNDKTIIDEDHSVSAPISGEFFFGNLIQVIWRQRLIVLFSVIVTVGGAIVYLSQATPVYTSTSRLYVERTGPEIITEQEGVMTQSKNYLYTQKELLKSTPILSSIVDDPSVNQMKMLNGVGNRVAYLKKKLNITVGNRDDLISVSLNSPYPNEAAQLVNTIVDSYITYHSTSKRSSSKDILRILQEGKGRRDRELEAKLKDLLEFTRVNSVSSLENNNDSIIMQRLARLSEALTEVQLEVISVKSDYNAVNAMITDPEQIKHFINSNRDQGKYPSLRSRYVQLLKKLEEAQQRQQSLFQVGTSNLPAAQTVELEIARLKRQISEQENNFIQTYRTALVQRWVTAQQKEASIRASLDQQQKLALELNSKSLEYTILKSDLNRTEKLCEEINNRIKDSIVTEDTGALNISILELAQPADCPTSPQKGSIMTISLIFGLLLGFMITLLRDWLDQRLRSAAEITTLLGVPVLGAIPSMGVKGSISVRGQKVYLEPVSPVAEAYRSIRTGIYFGASWEKVKTILVTSPTEGDGKTTVVSNLAVTMAQAGQRSLIIDADFRKPMQHKIFKIDQRFGLSGVLGDRDRLEQAIQPTTINGLDILPSGAMAANPSEMLSSKEFADILDTVSQKYDRILIDSPPVLHVTDACILGAICDGTVLVLNAEKSTRKFAEHSCDNLFSVGTNVLGVVVNDVSVEKNGYGYFNIYKNYPYPYRYGSGSVVSESAEKRHKEPIVIKTQAENIKQYNGSSQNKSTSISPGSTEDRNSNKND